MHQCRGDGVQEPGRRVIALGRVNFGGLTSRLENRFEVVFAIGQRRHLFGRLGQYWVKSPVSRARAAASRAALRAAGMAPWSSKWPAALR